MCVLQDYSSLGPFGNYPNMFGQIFSYSSAQKMVVSLDIGPKMMYIYIYVLYQNICIYSKHINMYRHIDTKHISVNIA